MQLATCAKGFHIFVLRSCLLFTRGYITVERSSTMQCEAWSSGHSRIQLMCTVEESYKMWGVIFCLLEVTTHSHQMQITLRRTGKLRLRVFTIFTTSPDLQWEAGGFQPGYIFITIKLDSVQKHHYCCRCCCERSLNCIQKANIVTNHIY